MMGLLMIYRRTLCLFVMSQCLCGMMSSAGKCFEMSPNDPYLLVGSTLQLNCTLKLPNTNTGCVHIDQFILNETKIVKGSKELGQELFEYHVTENTVQMTIENVTLEDSGTYLCRYGDSQINEALKVVHIGESPGVPENLICISKDHEDLACSFSLSKQSNIPIAWKMEYKVLHQSYIVNCTNSSNSEINITCGKIHYFWQYFKYEVSVKGENVNYKVNISKTFEALEANDSIVKPSPVVELNNTMNRTTDVVTIHWKGPDGLTFDQEVLYPMDYKITVTSRWNNFTKIIKNASERSKEYRLTDLVPYTNYSVSVVIKPTAALLDIYWSSPSTIHFITPKKVPGRSVSMTTGSYILYECEQAVCIVIYWKNPPERFWNGPIIGYKINVEEVDIQTSLSIMHGHVKKRMTFIDQPEYRLKRLIRPMIANISGLSVLAPLRNLRMEEDYEVDVTFINSEGMSKQNSQLLIPNWNQGQKLKVEWVSVEVGNTAVDISWSINTQICTNITSITVYWCLIDVDKTFNDSASVVHCKDLFDWSTINITGNCVNRTSQSIQQLQDYSKLRYAVSLETHNISGGLVWEKFRFRKGAVPEKPLYNVDTNGNELLIDILYGQYYDSEGGQPEQYIVTYTDCTEKCSTDVKNISFAANFTTPVHKIGALKAGSQYRVHVTAVNRIGHSKEGDSIEKKILKVDDSSNTSTTLEVVIGCVVAVVVFGMIGLGYYCWRRKHKQMENDLDVTVKPYETNYMNETYTVKDGDHDFYKVAENHDSGKGSDSPGSSLTTIESAKKGMTEIDDDRCHVSDPTVMGRDSDKQHLVCPGQKSSPVLSGYRKNVSDVTITGTAENSEDEIDDDDDLQNTDSLKKMLKVDVIDKVPKQGVPSEKVNIDKVRKYFAKEKNKNESDNLAMQNGGIDYSIATMPHGTDQQGLHHCASTATENKIKERKEYPKNELSELNMDESESIEGKNLKLIPSNQSDSTNKLEAVDMTQGEIENESVLDSNGSSEVDFEDFCALNTSNPYKDPDQVSLGDGSTISDVSDISDFEDVKNPDDDFGDVGEKGRTEKEKEVNGDCLDIDNAGQHVEKNLDSLDDKSKKAVDKVDQGEQIFDGVTTGDEKELNNQSNLEIQEENTIQDGKTISGDTGLESYIIAVDGDNGFVKSSEPKSHDKTLDLKKQGTISKHSTDHKDLSILGPVNSETSN